MGKVVRMSESEKVRNRDFNLGYDTAWEGHDIDIDKYENNEAYRRGYDAGEIQRDEDSTAGDFDPLDEDERRAVYGEDRDEL